MWSRLLSAPRPPFCTRSQLPSHSLRCEDCDRDAGPMPCGLDVPSKPSASSPRQPGSSWLPTNTSNPVQPKQLRDLPALTPTRLPAPARPRPAHPLGRPRSLTHSGLSGQAHAVPCAPRTAPPWPTPPPPRWAITAALAGSAGCLSPGWSCRNTGPLLPSRDPLRSPSPCHLLRPPSLLALGQRGGLCQGRGVPRTPLHGGVLPFLSPCGLVGYSPLSPDCLRVTVNTVWTHSKLALISQPPDYSVEEPVEGTVLRVGWADWQLGRPPWRPLQKRLLTRKTRPHRPCSSAWTRALGASAWASDKRTEPLTLAVSWGWKETASPSP